MIEVCLPGTGGMVPLEYRWLSCCWIEHDGKAILIDCGEGTQIALREAKCKLSRIEVILITHFHADHISGLPGLLLTLGNNGKLTPITIFGPAGLKEVFSKLMVISPVLPYDVKIVELTGNGHETKAEGFYLSYLSLEHSMECLGYCVSFKRKPIFNPKKAEELCIPKRFYKSLHNQNIIKLEDGRIIEPYMVLDGFRPDIKICYCTDTNPIDEIINFASGSNLFICEALHNDNEKLSKVRQHGHMLFNDSASLAKEANVEELWLTHYSPSIKDPNIYIDSAREIFKNTTVSYDGIRTKLGT